MKKFKFTSLFLLLALSVALFSCKDDKSYKLEYNLKAGDVYHQTVIMKMELTQKMMGQSMKVNSDIQMKYHYDVIDATADSIYTLAFVYDHLKMTMDIPGSSVTVDSETEAEIATLTDMNPIFKALTGVYIELKMNKQGKVISMTGLDKLVDAIVNSIDESMDETIRQQLVAQFEQQFGGDSMEKMFDQLSSYFPENEVKIGDTWNNNMHVGGQVNMDINVLMKLKNVKDHVATLEANGDFVTDEGGIVQEINGMETKITMKGTQKGIVKIDLNTGWQISSEMTQNFDTETEVGGAKIPQTIVMKTTIVTE